jgi:hypothetical protein
MHRSLVFAVVASSALIALPAGAETQRVDRQIPVFVRGRVDPAVVGVDEPIDLTVTVTNGLPRVIFYSGSWTEPVEWNGETISISIVDIYRNGQPGNLFLDRPEVTLPSGVSGIGRVRIESGRLLSIRTDAGKWVLRDGWLPGDYQVTVRVDNLAIDDYCTLSVTSDPIEFTVEAPPPSDTED